MRISGLARGMRSQLQAVALLASSALFGAGPAAPQYEVWAYSNSSEHNFASLTYEYDRRWRELRAVPDEIVSARQSAYRIHLFGSNRQGFMSVNGVRSKAPCTGNELRWAISPLAKYYACADNEYPHTRILIFLSSDNRLVRTVQSPTAWVANRHSIAFIDDDRLVFASVDDECPQEPKPHLGFSMMEVSVTHGAGAPSLLQRCVAGIVAGTHRVGFVRRRNSEYTLDGTHWTSGSLYGFDEADTPITDDHALVQGFKSRHPDFFIVTIDLGLVDGRR
jgi:hypothetical protein